ncbi:hypothetical protein EJD97_009308 [Solanum chilense]|uniref:Uncharacterized protein n=1 Tax=Solanum chilense TaxID=4083 RepID=A0A6N2BKB4_SOLCI|nr:hypothetical protein EJD97_009308 [Solanum chilense]
MAGQNEDNAPFIRFPDAASQERHHNCRTTSFCCKRAMPLNKVEDNARCFYARLVEFGWLRLTKSPPDVHFTWAREFYAILPTIISKWKKFYREYKKAFFYSSLITALGKLPEVPLFDADKVLTMDTPIHPLLIQSLSVSKSKRRKTSRVSNNRAAEDSDGEDPLLSERLEIYLETVPKKMESVYANFNLVTSAHPPRTWTLTWTPPILKVPD